MHSTNAKRKFLEIDDTQCDTDAHRLLKLNFYLKNLILSIVFSEDCESYICMNL